MNLRSTNIYCIMKVLPLACLFSLLSFTALSYGYKYFYITLPSIFILIAIILYKYYLLKSYEYIINDERIKLKKGIFNKEIHYLELYRIIDLETNQNILLQLISSMNLTLNTSDKSHSKFVFYGIKYDEEFSENLKVLIEEVRKRRVVEVD